MCYLSYHSQQYSIVYCSKQYGFVKPARSLVVFGPGVSALSLARLVDLRLVLYYYREHGKRTSRCQRFVNPHRCLGCPKYQG